MPLLSLAPTIHARSGGATGVDEPAASTLAALYEERLRLTPEASACRWFDGERWRTCRWNELHLRMQRYAAALRRCKLSPGDRIGVHLANGPEWLAIDWAAHTLGLVVVGLYGEDTAASVAHMLRDSGARVVFLRDERVWRELRAIDTLPQVEHAVLTVPAPETTAVRVRDLESWLPAASELPAPPPSAASPDALATIVYTSGTTGSPKGVMLSHRNVTANLFACLRAVAIEGADELCLSVLPLAHMFERTVGAYAAIAAGMEIAYSRGTAHLLDDLRELEPTRIVAVPRLFERIHAGLMNELQQGPAPRRALFRYAIEAGWNAYLRQSGNPAAPLPFASGLTRLVGQRLRERLGGRLRGAICGGAPLSPEISRTFLALGVPLLHGYGLTEASPVVSTNRPDANEPGSVGVPLDNVEVRVGPDGELLVRGPSVMMGYWGDPEATARVLDGGGWLHTGDKASRLDTRRLYLTGRIKELIVTATGEKASPEEIEQRLRECAFVDQVMVVGEARPYLGALVVASAEGLAELRRRLHLGCELPFEAVRAQLEEALVTLFAELLRCAPRSHQVRRVSLVEPPWAVANQLMTASCKMRRADIARRHRDDIERLYAGHFDAPRTDCSKNAGV